MDTARKLVLKTLNKERTQLSLLLDNGTSDYIKISIAYKQLKDENKKNKKEIANLKKLSLNYV